MEWQQIILIGLVGLLGGLLSGLLGIGGAIVIIPVLVLGFGYSQQMAQGTTLLMMVLPVGGLAAWQYYQKGFVDVKVALIMALFFFVGGYFGAKFAIQIPQDVLKKVFGVGLIAIAVKILFFDK